MCRRTVKQIASPSEKERDSVARPFQEFSQNSGSHLKSGTPISSSMNIHLTKANTLSFSTSYSSFFPNPSIFFHSTLLFSTELHRF